MQATQPHVVAADLGVTERGALFLLAVDPPQHRVNIDEAQRLDAGEQRRRRGQPAQHGAGGRVQLTYMPVSERPQECPQRAGGVYLVEQRGHATVAYQVQVIYRVRTSGYTGHYRGRLARRVGPGITGQTDPGGDSLMQPDLLGQCWDGVVASP